MAKIFGVASIFDLSSNKVLTRLMALLALIAFVLSGTTWASLTLHSHSVGDISHSLAGKDASPLFSALSLLMLALVAVFWFSKPVVSFAAKCLTVCVCIAQIYMMWNLITFPKSALRDNATAMGATSQPDFDASVTNIPHIILFLISGCVFLLLIDIYVSLILLARGGYVSFQGKETKTVSRYEKNSSKKLAAEQAQDPIVQWDTLSEGHDPTQVH